MSKVKKVESIVKQVLEENKLARGDNFILIYQVFSKMNPIVNGMSFEFIMNNHNDLNLPSLESVTRARRKLQAKHEHLRPSKKVQEIRKEEEEEYINYALDLN